MHVTEEPDAPTGEVKLHDVVRAGRRNPRALGPGRAGAASNTCTGTPEPDNPIRLRMGEQGTYLPTCLPEWMY